VEDHKPDVFLIREALRTANVNCDVELAPDGEQAIAVLERIEADETAACPDLVILDINLPRRAGRDVLRRIRHSPRCAATQVVVVTSSDSVQDRSDMAALGATGYFCKPGDYAEFMSLGTMIKNLLD